MIRAIVKKSSNVLYTVSLLHVFAKERFKHINSLKNNLLIVVIAFNNATIIETQYKHLIENLENNLDYLIAYNSSDSTSSRQIQFFCLQHNISYIRLPKNHLTWIRMSGSPLHLRQISWRPESSSKMSDQNEMVEMSLNYIRNNHA